MKTVIEYFPNFATNGIFDKMTYAPWAQAVSGNTLDSVYFTSHSGAKLASSFVRYYSTNDIAQTAVIALQLYAMFGKQWERLWADYTATYSALSPYKLDETEVRELNNVRSIARDATQHNTGTVTTEVDLKTTEDETSTITHNTKSATTEKSQNYTYGFNSQERAAVGEVEGQSETNNTGTDTTVVDNDGTQKGKTTVTNNLTSEIDDDTSNSLDEDETITREKSGNLGNKTFQEILTQEIELWKWNFFEQVFNDCDKMLTLSVFDPCKTL